MNYVRVGTPRRWRWRRARQIASLAAALVLWFGGVGAATAMWWRDNPRPGVVDAATVTAVNGLLLAAAIAYRRPNAKPQVADQRRQRGPTMAGAKKGGAR